MITSFVEEDDDDDQSGKYDGEIYDLVDVFKDPFLDIGPYLNSDENIINNPGLSELIFFLSAAWLDPYFYRNRVTCSLIPNEYFPEEKGLLILISKLLNIDVNEPLDHHLLTVFCMITGRCQELLTFDPVTRTNVHTVNFRAPLNLFSQFGEGPCCVVPFLTILAINESVPFPSSLCLLNEKKIDGDHAVMSETKTTTDHREAFIHANRHYQSEFPLSFEAGITLRNVVTRFPTSDGGFWVRVKCGPFAIAYGDDISNGKGKVKYPWENRFNGNPPPTLSEDGINCSIQWMDSDVIDTELPVYKAAKQIASICPVCNPEDYKEKFVEAMTNLHPEVTISNYVTLWANPETGRIRDEEMYHLVNNNDNVFMVECNAFCECKRNCPCSFTNHPPNSDLMLFYSPDKDWGVVATKDIEPGTLITTYAGKFMSDWEATDANDELFYFALEYGDMMTNNGYHALKHCNIGRFINQSHETPLDAETLFGQPNASAFNIVSTLLITARIGIFSRRKIFKGEEITLSYGDHYKMERNCACNQCLRDVEKRKNILKFFENEPKGTSKGKRTRSRAKR